METEGDNPYASPMAAGDVAPTLPAELWRVGDLVIAHYQANWPKYCVKTGGIGDYSINLPVAMQYPNWLLLPLFGVPFLGSLLAIALPKSTVGLFIGLGMLVTLVVGFVAALVLFIRMAKSTRINFFVSQRYMAQRRVKLRIANGLTILGFAGIALSFLLAPYGWLRLAGLVSSIVVIAIGGRFRASWLTILRPTKTKKEYVVFQGASELFLSHLSSWPYGPT
jgi:hypothetical protein